MSFIFPALVYHYPHLPVALLLVMTFCPGIDIVMVLAKVMTTVG